MALGGGEEGLPGRVDRAGGGHDPEVGLRLAGQARAGGARPRRGGGPPCGSCRPGTTPPRCPTRAGRRASGAPRGRCSRPPGCSTGSGGRRGRTPPGARAAPGCGTAPARSGAAGSPTGTGSSARSECRTAPLRATISAFSFSTSTTARRIGTTQSGSKLALSSRALPKRRHLHGRRHLDTLRSSTGVTVRSGPSCRVRRRRGTTRGRRPGRAGSGRPSPPYWVSKRNRR